MQGSSIKIPLHECHRCEYHVSGDYIQELPGEHGQVGVKYQFECLFSRRNLEAMYFASTLYEAREKMYKMIVSCENEDKLFYD